MQTRSILKALYGSINEQGLLDKEAGYLTEGSRGLNPQPVVLAVVQ